MKLKGKAIKTRYWLPGENYLKYLVAVADKVAKDGDIIVISEKALSIAHGNLVDESQNKPSIYSIIITFFLMRIIWAYILGPLCRFKLKTINFLRRYPLKEGAAHKQICLRLAGVFQALKHYSEGGIDLTNVPYSYACLPLQNPQEIAEKIAPPFYMLFNVKQSFALYKVLWKEQAKGLIAAVIDSINDPILGIKIVIPNHKLMFVPCEKENEAHFICAVLNSIIARLIAKSYIIETQISTHIMDYVNVPQFDDNNDIHRKLAELSKIAHRLVASGEESKLSEIEEEIDRLVAQLYGISDDELRDIKISLKILEGEEIEEEELAEEEPREVKVDFLEAVVRPNRIGSFEVAILNPLKERVTIELQLPEYPVKLETDKEEDRLRVKVPPLKAGEYEIPYKVITSQKTIEGSFTLYVKEEKRHRVREELESKLDELLGERL